MRQFGVPVQYFQTIWTSLAWSRKRTPTEHAFSRACHKAEKRIWRFWTIDMRNLSTTIVLNCLMRKIPKLLFVLSPARGSPARWHLAIQKDRRRGYVSTLEMTVT